MKRVSTIVSNLLTMVTSLTPLTINLFTNAITTLTTTATTTTTSIPLPLPLPLIIITTTTLTIVVVALTAAAMTEIIAAAVWVVWAWRRRETLRHPHQEAVELEPPPSRVSDIVRCRRVAALVTCWPAEPRR